MTDHGEQSSGVSDRGGVVDELLDSGTGVNLSDTTLPFALPGDPGMEITDYPEG